MQQKWRVEMLGSAYVDPIKIVRQCDLALILHAAPVGAGPIEWNYRCTGTRDKLNELQRVRSYRSHLESKFTALTQFLTNEYQVGLKLWKKNPDGTINKEWFVSQASKALLIPIDAVR
jgi:hypothetical protein